MLAKTPIEELIFDKETILSFLESKDPNKKYNYSLAQKCVFAQFLIEHGANPTEFYDNYHCECHCIPPGVWYRISIPPAGTSSISTFGAALARAKEILKDK